jgi:EAL domain-containing protein (putative c-di-GMP-specific phosphodiesterase class I)
LRENKILIALDDCGFGRTSLESVITLEPEIVKLDARCTRGVATDRTRRRLLQRMTKLMLGTGADIIAEGSESAEDAAVVKELGISSGQGYLWGRPVSVQM